MFVFDVGDTEPTPDAKPLPAEVTHPLSAMRSYNWARAGANHQERQEGRCSDS